MEPRIIFSTPEIKCKEKNARFEKNFRGGFFRERAAAAGAKIKTGGAGPLAERFSFQLAGVFFQFNLTDTTLLTPIFSMVTP